MSGVALQLIAGLGNPGARYAGTRHNAGYLFVDELATRAGAAFAPQARVHGELARIGLAGCDLRLLKPSTFMNLSGQSVAAAARYFRIPVDELLVVHDDLDLPPGTLRLKQGGGHGGHNGLRDIIAHLGADFWRLRVGVGRPPGGDVVGYVLSRAPADEEGTLRAALDAGVAAVECLLRDGAGRAMQDLHSRGATPRAARDQGPSG